MSNRNYFKCTGGELFFFFESGVRESIEEAFERAKNANEALEYKGLPFLYAGELVMGPWKKCNIVGHRPKADIVRDIKKAASDTERTRHQTELDSLRNAQAAA